MPSDREVHGSVQNSLLVFLGVVVYAEVMSSFVYAKPVGEIQQVKLTCFRTTNTGPVPEIQLGLSVPRALVAHFAISPSQQ